MGIDNLGKGEIIPFLYRITQIQSLEEYRKVFSPLLWNKTNEILNYLKEYEIWMDGISNLMTLTEKYKDQLSDKEYTRNTYLLSYVYLKILDKLDCWEEFVETFDELRKIRAIKHPHNPRFDVTDDFLKRYELIKRKIETKSQGKSYRHLLHKQKESLTAEEYQRRISVFKFWMEYAIKFEDTMKKRRNPLDKEGQKR